MIEQVKRSFLERGYHMEDDLAHALFFALNARPTAGAILEGPPGTGKTFLAEVTADVLGAELLVYQCFPNTREDDLMIKLIPDDKSVSGIKKYEGIIPQAIDFLKQGKKVVLLLDEWDKTRPSADAFLLDFLQRHRVNYGDYKESLTPEQVANLTVFLTSNGFREISEPLVRRLPVIHLVPPTLRVVAKVLADHEDNAYFPLALKIYVAGLRAFRDERLGKPVTIQELRQFLDAARSFQKRNEKFPWKRALLTFISKEPEAHEVIMEYLYNVTDQDVEEVSKSFFREDESDPAISQRDAEILARAVAGAVEKSETEREGDFEKSEKSLENFEEVLASFKRVREEVRRAHEKIKRFSKKVKEDVVSEKASIVVHTGKKTEDVPDLTGEESFFFKVLSQSGEVSYDEYLRSLVVKDGYVALLKEFEDVLVLPEPCTEEFQDEVKNRVVWKNVVKTVLDHLHNALTSGESEVLPVESSWRLRVSLKEYGEALKSQGVVDDVLKILMKSASSQVTMNEVGREKVRFKPLEAGMVMVQRIEKTELWSYWFFDRGKKEVVLEVLLRFVPSESGCGHDNDTIINFVKDGLKKTGEITRSWVGGVYGVLSKEMKRVKEKGSLESSKKQIEKRVEIAGNRVEQFVKSLLGDKDVFDESSVKATADFIAEMVKSIQKDEEKCIELIVSDLKEFAKRGKITPDVLVNYVDEKIVNFLRKWGARRKKAGRFGAFDYDWTDHWCKTEATFPPVVWFDGQCNVVRYTDYCLESRYVQGVHESLEKSVRCLYTEKTASLEELKKAELKSQVVKKHSTELYDWLKSLYVFVRRVFPDVHVGARKYEIDQNYYSSMMRIIPPSFFMGNENLKRSDKFNLNLYRHAYPLEGSVSSQLENKTLYFPFLTRYYLRRGHAFGFFPDDVPGERINVFRVMSSFFNRKSELNPQFRAIFGEDGLKTFDLISLELNKQVHASVHAYVKKMQKSLVVELERVSPAKNKKRARMRT